MRTFEMKDRNGNFYYCNKGIITLKRHNFPDPEVVGEINEGGHLVIGRWNPVAIGTLGDGIAIDKVSFDSVEEDKYIVMNTTGGCFCRKKEEINHDAKTMQTIGFGHQDIIIVPMEGLKKAALGTKSEQEKAEDRSVLPNKVPYDMKQSIEGVKPVLEMDTGLLKLPVDVDKKYRYWSGGQSLKDTLIELNAPRHIAEKYLPVHLLEKYWKE